MYLKKIIEQFLLDGSGQEPDRVLIFGRLGRLKILKYFRIWYCDSTFKIYPLLFSKVYIILAEALGCKLDNVCTTSKQKG